MCDIASMDIENGKYNYYCRQNDSGSDPRETGFKQSKGHIQIENRH